MVLDGLAFDVAAGSRISLQDHGAWLLRGRFHSRPLPDVLDAASAVRPIYRQVPLRDALLATTKVRYVHVLNLHY